MVIRDEKSGERKEICVKGVLSTLASLEEVVDTWNTKSMPSSLPPTKRQYAQLVEPYQKPVAIEVLMMQPTEQKKVVSVVIGPGRQTEGKWSANRNLHSEHVGPFLHKYVTSDPLFTLRPLVFCASAHILIVTSFIWNLSPVSFHLEAPPQPPIPPVHLKPLDPKAQLTHRALALPENLR